MKSLILTIKKIGFLKTFGGVALVALPFFLLLAKKLYDELYLKKSALLATDLAYEEYDFVENDKDKYLRRKLAKRKIKVKRTKNSLEILKFNPHLNAQNITALVATIERIFKRKVINVDFKNFGFFKHKEKIVFTFEHFKKIITENDLKELLEVGSYWLGQNGKSENLIQDKKNPFMFIAGGQGSGKSVAVASYIVSLISGFSQNKKPQPKLVMISGDKMSEFVPLIKRLKSTGEVLTFNANKLEEIKALNELLKNHLDKCGEFFKIIKDENLIVRHWFNVEHPKKPDPIIFLYDEAPEYLGELLKIKVSKESSPEEIELGQINDQKKRLGFQLDRSFKTLRETGTYIFIVSQTALSTDLEAISFSNLRNNFLLGRGITKNVFSIFGIPSELQEQKLGEGQFAFYNGREYGILKTPFLTFEDDK